jgi:two-component system LytT family response regulator
VIRALLIDDETTARDDLRAKLAVHPEVAIRAEAATFNSARALLARTDYDLVFLDIQLIGGNSFDLVPDVSPAARIVFVTAYDSYALRAFEINALDYLLKPVVPARLAATLRRLTLAPAPAPGELPASTASSSSPAPEAPAGPALRVDDTVYLRSGQRARFAPVMEISVISAHDNYSEVQLADGAKIFLRKSLKAWEDTIPATHFMRVHRTQIVNLARVTRYERDRDEHTLLTVEGAADRIAASRDRWSDLRARLAAIRPTP